jgi:hypothetical protein
MKKSRKNLEPLISILKSIICNKKTPPVEKIKAQNNLVNISNNLRTRSLVTELAAYKKNLNIQMKESTPFNSEINQSLGMAYSKQTTSDRERIWRRR